MNATTYSALPMIISIAPMVGSVLVYATSKISERVRNGVAVTSAAVTAFLAAMLFMQVQGAAVEYSLPWFLGFGLTWTVDYIGGVFSLIVSVVWLFSTIFACEYMGHEHARTRFFTFLTFTLGACVGVFLAGDLFSLFLFFEVMTFSAYVLVIHEETPKALEAGNVYLYMSIVGGLALLGVVFLLQHVAGTTEFTPLLEALIEGGISPWIPLTMAMLGFGVKAGMLPLHIWLPKAHPVAPSPASALLSALMIKAGAYGFLRLLLTVLTPSEQAELWIYSQQFGYVFLWIGAATMVIGGLMALMNQQFKVILAYSSISQMGYILFALGIGAFLGTRGAFGFAGAWMHMLNHAFYKSMLFLIAGAVMLKTHDLQIPNLGGLRKRMPWAFAFTLVAAAGITAIPGFNGYVSKVLIHEAILEAYHLEGLPSLLWLERIFVFTGGLTVAYITKLWLGAFGGPLKEHNRMVEDISIGHRVLFAVYTAVLLSIGIFAQTRVDQFVLPAASLYPFSSYDINHLMEVPFWTAKELAGPAKAYVIGISLLLVLHKFGRHIRTPRWLSIEYALYRPISLALRSFIVWLGQMQAPHIDRDLLERLAKKLPRNPFGSSVQAQKRRQAVAARRQEFVNRVRREHGLPKRDIDPKQDEAFWNTANLGFDSLILALIIAVFLLVFLAMEL